MSLQLHVASIVGIFVLLYCVIEASPVDLNNGTLTIGNAKISVGVSSSTSGSSPSPSSTPVPSSTVAPVSITTPNTESQKNGTSTGGIVKTVIAIISSPKKTSDDEECDEEPVPEPEGAHNATSTDRQGKELKLGDEKDRYTHENSTAEPEPEVASNGKLTGNQSTTASPATGSSATFSTSYATYFAIATVTLCNL